MYIAAGEIIPAVTGESWQRFVTARLLEPLGMDESTLSVDAIEGRDNVATPHIGIDGEPTPVAWYDLAKLRREGNRQCLSADDESL